MLSAVVLVVVPGTRLVVGLPAGFEPEFDSPAVNLETDGGETVRRLYVVAVLVLPMEEHVVPAVVGLGGGVVDPVGGERAVVVAEVAAAVVSAKEGKEVVIHPAF